jgi:metal-dependent amidase/aminoacylase/carboxypeptidase family protein
LASLYRAAEKVVGAKRVTGDVVTCGAEDFSYFLQLRPGTFFFVGAALQDQPLRPHHKSVFDFDEGALTIAASVFLFLVRDKLSL